jgi:hypothetical protein
VTCRCRGNGFQISDHVLLWLSRLSAHGAPGAQRLICGEDVSLVASVGCVPLGIIFTALTPRPQSRDSSVCIATGYGSMVGVQFPVGARDFSLLHSVQTGSGSLPVSCLISTGGFIPGSNATGT